MLATLVRLFSLIFLINIISGLYLPSDQEQQVYPLVKQARSAENDYEYVWFTRDLGHEQYAANRPQNLRQPHPNFFRSKISNQKYPYLKGSTFERE